ncbi:DUF2252 domain-containing protein [Microbacterium sp. SS28]|uniref:DUF2252 domain-containing protein n=1 Tax=Microbacterium sp. SS28 TaxID=2919948 RepID=UPI001FAA4D09|nr:DUF2252 domain-containing protein [Microbacterium sp. SS28]
MTEANYISALEWSRPSTVAERLAEGKAAREAAPRSGLAHLTTTDRDPLSILEAQNATRMQELVPLRVERMSASPFAFYRGTAAIQAADLAADPHSGILVASCGDAHVSNFGFFASPQRTLMFDLNDFDEAAFAPWEWDLKRLVTSVVIAGQATSRDDDVVQTAALAAVRTYARAMAANADRSSVQRFFEHFDAESGLKAMDSESQRTMRAAIKEAEKRTGERAARKLTTLSEDGRLLFVERPPTMTHTTPEIEGRLHDNMLKYLESANVDVRLVLRQYVLSDIAMRVVGVGSVGTLCTLILLQDGDANALILQGKQAGRSVLEEYGGIEQPPAVAEFVAEQGEGGRVVALQRILQAVSDPFLGHLKAFAGDFYVRQFNDMKGGIEMNELEDTPFRQYAESCATVLARAHSQSPHAAQVAGYIGNGRIVGEAILEWAYAYADLSRADYDAFVAAHAKPHPATVATQAAAKALG